MASSSAKAALFDALASVALRSATAAARRSSMCWRRVSARSTRSPARSRRASRTPRSTCRCSPAPGSFGPGVMGHGSSTGWRVTGSRICGRRCATSPPSTSPRSSLLADEYLGDRDGIEQLSAAELQSRLERDEVVVLDVRPEAEFRSGHVPGAISAPITTLASLVVEAAATARGRRLLPRPVLRLRRRCGAAPSRSRREGAPARCRLPRVAPGRLPVETVAERRDRCCCDRS